jgi:hypothetical protein
MTGSGKGHRGQAPSGAGRGLTRFQDEALRERPEVLSRVGFEAGAQAASFLMPSSNFTP